MTRDGIEALIEAYLDAAHALIRLLDEADGDADAEPDLETGEDAS